MISFITSILLSLIILGLFVYAFFKYFLITCGDIGKTSQGMVDYLSAYFPEITHPDEDLHISKEKDLIMFYEKFQDDFMLIAASLKKLYYKWKVVQYA